MKKKVRIYNPQYAPGGITQGDIQQYLMSQSQQAQQPQITEDSLVNSIYDELSLLGDKSGYVDQGSIDDLADKFQQTYGVDNDYILNLVNEVYSTLAPSDYKKDVFTAAAGSPVPDYMSQGQDVNQDDYQQDMEDDNLAANVATYDDYYGDDTDMTEAKFGGISRKKFMRDFIKKAELGMEQTSESITGTNDTDDGRSQLVKGFESGMKKAVVKAVAKNEFEKNQKQMSTYFEQGGFFDPTRTGDDEAYAHHLNLMATANKDIFSQPNVMMVGQGMQKTGGMVMNPFADSFGELQKFMNGGVDPSVAELDGTNLVDPSDPYTRTFADGGTQEEYQDYIDWYNENAPAEGMSKAAPQSIQEWRAENYPQQPKPKAKQSSIPNYNAQNAMLAAQAMAQAMGYNMPSTPMGTLMQSVNPFQINRGMKQKGMPMIAGTNMPFQGMIGPNAQISEIYTDPRRFGKDSTHIKFVVPGQSSPMLGMNWKDQVAAQQNNKEVTTAKEQNKNELDKSTKSLRRDELDKYQRSNVKGLEGASRVAIRAGERNAKGDIRRALREDPNAFYEGPAQEGMMKPMSDEEYMARVNANRRVAPVVTRSVKESMPTFDSKDLAELPYQMKNPYITPTSIKPIAAAPNNKGRQTEEFCYGNSCFEVPEEQYPEYELFNSTPEMLRDYGDHNNADWYNKETQEMDLSKIDKNTFKKILKEQIADDDSNWSVSKKFRNDGSYDNLDSYADSWLKYQQDNQKTYGDRSFKGLRRDKAALENFGLAEKYADFLNATGKTAEGKPNSIWDTKGPLQFTNAETPSLEEGGNILDYMAYGGNVMYPDGGFVYNNPVDNRTNPVMADKDFFSINTNNNSIPDYLEWQSTPDQEVDVEYKQKNQVKFQPQGLMPFLGDTVANNRGRQEGIVIDKFNNQNAGNSGGREQADELISQGMFDINSGKEIISGFEGIVGAGKGVGQQYFSKFGGQLDFEEGGEYDLSEEEIQALIDAGVDLTLLEDYED